MGMRAGRVSRRRDVDMTEGPILHHILRFSLPLLAGSVLQQMYGAVDVWVIGNFASNEAFSAVGSVTQVINVLVGLFLGLSTGFEVIVARYYGAKNERRVHDTVHTAIAAAILGAVLLTAVGQCSIPFMLNLMDMPAEVRPEAKTYLTIYFAGAMGLTVYNIGSAILRAVGDSYHPLCFLAFASAVNIGLDFLLVAVFDLGVAGVALATVAAQGGCALLVLRMLMGNGTAIRLDPRELRIDAGLLRQVGRIGIPAGLQTSVTAFSNVFLHSYIYYFGADCMSGWTAYDKIIQFMNFPMQSIALTTNTFVSQNLGGGQPERAREGVKAALILDVAVTAALMICNELFAPVMIAFFNSREIVVAYGTRFLRWISPFYVLNGLCLICAAAMRGFGKSRTPTAVIIAFYVVFRQVFLFAAVSLFGNHVGQIIAAYDLSWALGAGVFFALYRRTVHRGIPLEI